MSKLIDYSKRDDHILRRAHRVIQDRFYLMEWGVGAIPNWAYIYDSTLGATRFWVRGSTLKAWRCWLTDQVIPANTAAWRYSTPRTGYYPDSPGTPGRRPYIPGEEIIRVHTALFDRYPDVGPIIYG